MRAPRPIAWTPVPAHAEGGGTHPKRLDPLCAEIALHAAKWWLQAWKRNTIEVSDVPEAVGDFLKYGSAPCRYAFESEAANAKNTVELNKSIRKAAKLVLEAWIVGEELKDRLAQFDDG